MMADNRHGPTPVPRKPRTGNQKPPQQQQPPPSSSPFVPRTEHQTIGGVTPVRYIPPVTPQSQLSTPQQSSTSLGGHNTMPGSASPPFNQQMSTPLPSSSGGSSYYQPPVTPTNLRTTMKEYSGPQMVMSPLPPAGGSRGSDTNISRKDSWNSSRSSLSSEPPSPSRLLSDDLNHLGLEIEQKKELKLKLLQEVGHLTQQKNMLTTEVDQYKSDSEELKKSCEEYNKTVEKLSIEENSIRRRLAQCEQNLQLMGRLAAVNPTPDSQREQHLKEREREVEEKELSFEERSSAIRQKELQLQSEADILFQRKKELDLREYDVKNFGGPSQPTAGSVGNRHPDMLEHEEREQKIQLKEQELFRRETDLTEREISLKREKDHLLNWEENVKHEDNRAQQNLKRAKELMQEANKLKQEALDASKIAAMLEDERKETTANTIDGPSHKEPSTQGRIGGSGDGDITVPSIGIVGGGTGKTGGSIGGGNIGGNIGGGSSGCHYGDSTTSPSQAGDCSNDLMMARFYNMEINAALAEEDARLAKQMSKQMSAKPRDTEAEDADFQFAFQTQLEFMGIAPGSVDAEALKKQLQQQLDDQKKRNEATQRDGELAASLTQNET